MLNPRIHQLLNPHAARRNTSFTIYSGFKDCPGEISNGQDYYQVLQSLESADDSINKMKETVEKQIDQFILLNKQQKNSLIDLKEDKN